MGWAERTATALGFDLATANARDLTALTMATTGKHSMLAQLRSALKHWYAWLDRNDAPLRAVRVPPAPEMVNKALEPDQAARLVAVATGWWPAGTAVLVGMYMALRRFEIAKMEWDRFDDRLEWYTVTGKRDKTATLPVHPHLRSELETRVHNARWVFPGRPHGQHVTPATVWDWTIRVGVEAGLDHLKPHELRHTALTTALDGTENLRSVMAFARHPNSKHTVGYTRTTREQLIQVSQALDY